MLLQIVAAVVTGCGALMLAFIAGAKDAGSQAAGEVQYPAMGAVFMFAASVYLALTAGGVCPGTTPL